MGFFRYQGLPLERVAAAWLRSQIIMPTRLHFRAKNERLELYRASTKKEKEQRKPPRHIKKNRRHGKEKA